MLSSITLPINFSATYKVNSNAPQNTYDHLTTIISKELRQDEPNFRYAGDWSGDDTIETKISEGWKISPIQGVSEPDLVIFDNNIQSKLPQDIKDNITIT